MPGTSHPLWWHHHSAHQPVSHNPLLPRSIFCPFSHSPPDFFHPCGQCVKSSSSYSEHLQPLHPLRSVPPRIRLFVYCALSKLLANMQCTSCPLTTDDHAVIYPFHLFLAILSPSGLLCSSGLIFEHLQCLFSFCPYLFMFLPSLEDFLAYSYFSSRCFSSSRHLVPFSTLSRQMYYCVRLSVLYFCHRVMQ